MRNKKKQHDYHGVNIPVCVVIKSQMETEEGDDDKEVKIINLRKRHLFHFHHRTTTNTHTHTMASSMCSFILFVSECQMPTSHHLRDNKLLLAQERMAKSTEVKRNVF